MDARVWLQVAEALGPTNRWFCSEKHGCHVDDADLLLTHYIRHGGAEDFARRYESGLVCADSSTAVALMPEDILRR